MASKQQKHDPLLALGSQLSAWQKQGLVVVLVTGVFDILHVEHIRFLQKAKAAGDKLVVGIETDVRVKEIKGEHRPINSQEIRLEQLRALRPVDTAFLLPAQFNSQADWDGFMQQLHPDMYAVSSHTSWLDSKQAICEKNGITFKIVHDFNPELSTSALETKLKAEL